MGPSKRPPRPSASGVTDEGADLARRQLLDLVEVAGGAVEVIKEEITDRGSVMFTISMDTSGYEAGASGIRVRPRERFKVIVGDQFPFAPPSVLSVHRRWARTPHVQWGSVLCLYAASSIEWNPSDGMRGFIGRLSLWVERAVAGTLDPDGQPLHPPAVYTSPDAGRVLIHPDLGDLVPWAADGSGDHVGTLMAWCAINTGRRRIDVLEWLDTETAAARAEDTNVEMFDGGRPVMVLPVILTPDELGFEYPTDVKSLSAGLTESGYNRDDLLRDLAVATHINRALRARQRDEDAAAAGESWDGAEDPASPLFTAVLVGTPSRRLEGKTRLAHLAAWKLAPLTSKVTELFTRILEYDTKEMIDLRQEVRDLAFSLFDTSSIDWMRVMETRPEVTRRRDQDTPSNWLTGKNVLVLGCGALGAPVAEFCVRAGVSGLTVADNGVVNPGILVRQPYTDADIGRNKSVAVARRLSTIRADLDVNPMPGNVRTTFFAAGITLDGYDLVIDATADASVRSIIERARKSATFRPPLVTMVIGHNAERGLVTTNLTTATGAGADTFRKVSLLASAGEKGWEDIGEDLFPKSPRTELFFPEPGCSSPTFTGSAAQTAALAGLVLNEALTTLSSATGSDGTGDAVAFASAVRLGQAATLGTTRASWPADLVQTEESNAFEVRVTANALTTARTETRHGARTKGPAIETGGMLLGEVDDSTGIVYVDKVTGPPPDSYMSRTYFQHGTEGVQERVDAESERTGRLLGFVGFWHTHPSSRAWPSPTDEQGMASIVGPDGSTRRALMMILGGGNDTWDTWVAGATASPDTYFRVVPRAAGGVTVGHPGYVGGRDLQQLPPGEYFRGDGTRVQVAPGGLVTARTSLVVTSWRWPWQRSHL